MLPYFNTSGPCVPGDHYMLPPVDRLRQVLELSDERRYFSLRAGHQTGKTTCARWLVQHYNHGDRYLCTWVDIQSARENPDLAQTLRVILQVLCESVRRDLPGITPPDIEPLLRTPQTALRYFLSAICAAAPRPLVVLIDEADGLVGPAMVSFLTQIRQGYIDRSATPFPQSLALIGRREVRDYVLTQEDRRAMSWLGTSSPFNICAETPTLQPFSPAEVAALLQQHTAATGQVFEPAAAARIHDLSCGQPWLVNALADQIVRRDVRDRAQAVVAADVDRAKETIIIERRSHIDTLIARLHEERVRRIVEPMLTGEQVMPEATLDDDFAYVLGLGLIARRGGQFQIANPIYKEVIPRVLSYAQQAQLNQSTSWYLREDGGLDLGKLMAAWQEYWREDGHLAAAGFSYREAGPHLMLMAFLQRVINGGGRIDREYGLGRKALDLLITWPLPAGQPGGQIERHAIEVKLRRDARTQQKGLAQLGAYLEQAGLDEGWLVLFDRRKGRSWKERLFIKRHRRGPRTIHVVGC